MNASAQDVSAARAHLERFRDHLRTHPNPAEVKQVAVNVAGALFGDSPLTAQANRLPVPTVVGVRPRGIAPAPHRTPQFDAAVDDLLVAFDAGLDAIADYQRRVQSNASVARSEIRQSVLAYLARTPIDLQWGGEVQWTLGLSDAQIIDALEYWEEQSAIAHGGYQVYSGAGDWIWKIELTPRGRDYADGTRTISSHLKTTLVVQHQTFNGPVANAGPVHGNVTQNIGVPPVPSDVRAALHESPMGEVLLDAIDDEQRRAEPRPDKIRKAVAGIKSFLETTNAVGDAWDHFTQWSSEIGDWLSGFM